MDSSREGKEAGEQEQPGSSAKASEPTVQEISDYAEYLGLRPGEDGEASSASEGPGGRYVSKMPGKT